MAAILRSHDRLTGLVSGRTAEGLVLLSVRIAFAGIFLRSAWTKVEQGSWPWAALALTLIVRGGGMFSLDAALLKARGT